MLESRERLRASLEATRLGFGLTESSIRQLVDSAGASRTRGLCVPACFLGCCVSAVQEFVDWDPDIVTVANFPTGDHEVSEVLAVARRAGRRGADHLDLVVPGRFVCAGEWSSVTEFIQSVRLEFEDAAGSKGALKVILETAALSENQIRRAAESAIDAGARWLKTSTGFHPAGGATEQTVRLLREIAPAEVGVKASGGIRTAADALHMLDAGADRVGTSAEAVIMEGVPGPGS